MGRLTLRYAEMSYSCGSGSVSDRDGLLMRPFVHCHPLRLGRVTGASTDAKNIGYRQRQSHRPTG